MNRIDIRLAVLAREIEAAKPKGLSFEEFEQVNWNFARTRGGEWRQVFDSPQQEAEVIQAIAKPYRAVRHHPKPETIQEEKSAKFAVGDKVRSKKYGDEWPDLVVTDIFHVPTILCMSRGVLGGFNVYDLELLPSPAQTDGEWVRRAFGSPAPLFAPDQMLEIEWPSGNKGVFRFWHIRGWDLLDDGPVAYRVLGK